MAKEVEYVEYAIFDAFEAAILVMKGFPITYRYTGERTMFVFPLGSKRKQDLMKTVDSYRHRGEVVDAFTYAEAVKDIKREMYINKSAKENV